MKKFLVVLTLFTALIFVVSCGDEVIKVSKDGSGESQTDEDAADTSADTGDTTPDESNTGDSQPDENADTTDSGDSQPDGDADTTDSGDTTPDKDTDTTDSGDSQPDGDADTTDSGNDSGDSQPDEDADTYEKEEYEKTIPVPEDQNNEYGAPCDPGTFVEFCDESTNSVIYCDEEGKVNYDECEEAKCMTTIGIYGGEWKNKNYASCYETCETLKQNTECIDSDPIKDYRAGGIFIKDFCLKTSKGNLEFYISEQCDTPCNEEKTACIELYKVPENQNNEKDAPCDPGTFVEFCDGDTVVYCGSGNVVRAVCPKHCLTTVGLYDENKGMNTSNCYSSCEEPGPSDSSTTICKEKTYYYGDSSFKMGSLRKDYCLETSKGNSYFSKIVVEECNTGCTPDGNACIGLENPGTQNNNLNAACNTSTFIETCDGNTAVYCHVNGYVLRWDCSESGLVCANTKGIFDNKNKNYAYCFHACKESLQQCESEDVGDQIIGFITYDICTKTSSGWVDFEFPRVQTCFNGCASDGKNCAAENN